MATAARQQKKAIPSRSLDDLSRRQPARLPKQPQAPFYDFQENFLTFPCICPTLVLS